MSDVIDKKEKLLIEYIIASEDMFIKVYSILQSEYFTPPLDKVIGYVKDHFSKYHALADVDKIEVDTGILLKERELDVSDVEYVIDEIEDHCQRAAMTNAVLAGADIIADPDGNIADVNALVREALLVKVDSTLGTELFTNPEERMKDSDEGLDPIQLGIEKLDNQHGDFNRGEVTLFVAPTGGGKSVMLGNVTYLASNKGLDTVIISVEMNEDRYSSRLDSLVTGIDLSARDEVSLNKIAERLRELKETNGSITTKRVNGKFGLEDLRTYLMEYHLINKKYPDVLVMDYIDIFSNMNVPRNISNKHEWDELKTHGFRDICEEFGMYGFTASQLNRDGYGDVIDIGVQHIAGGISKAQGVDNVIAMIATEEDLDNNSWTFSPLKLRNNDRAKVGKETLYRDPDNLRILSEPAMSKKHTSPVIKNTPKPEISKPSPSGKSKMRDVLKMMK